MPGPLSGTQRALWLEEQTNPGTVANVIVQAVRVRAPLDPALFRQALQATVDRHPALRTTFDDSSGVPLQVVHERRDVALQIEDATGWADGDVERRLSQETRRPFDLTDGPLARFVWLRRASDDQVLALVIHHLVTDMWSMALLCREVLARCAGTGADLRSGRRRPGVSLQDVIAAEHELVAGPAGDEPLAFWTDTLRDAPLSVPLPTDRLPRPTRPGVGGIVPVDIDAELGARIRVVASATGTNVADVLLSAFLVVLQRYGQDDLVIGGVSANRSPRTAGLMGCLVSPLPLHCDVSGDPTFTELVGRTARVVDDAFAHAAYPYQEVIEHPRPGGARGWPALNVVFTWQKTHRGLDRDLVTAMALDRPGVVADVAGLRLESVRVGQRGVGSDLALVAAEGGGKLAASLEFAADVFDRATVERIADHLRTALGAATGHPDRPVAQLPISNSAERAAVEAAWSGPELAVDPYTTAHGLVERRTRRTPERVAVRSGTVELTYGELNARANRLAHRLLALGTQPGHRIGVCLGRSVDMVVAVLAVAKAGGAYVPLDPRWPPARVASVAHDATATLVVAHRATALMAGQTGLPVVALDADDELIPSGPSHDPETAVRQDDLLYVLSTSGSTGRAKGVEVEHRSVVNYLHATAKGLGIREDDVVLAVTSLSFDPAVADIFLPLAQGASVVIADDEAALDPSRLIDFIRREQVTFLQATPTTWRMLLEAGWEGREALTALCGGEPMEPALARALRARCGRVWNAYGPTEATVDATMHLVTDVPEAERVPIGRPIANVRCYVLDGSGRPAPLGVPGELFVGGAGVARGYANQPELTAQRFLPDPFSAVEGARMYRTGDICRLRADGCLEHLGRTDHQVKVRGHRVELGEIEAVLMRHPGLRAAAVTTARSAAGDARLVAHVVPATQVAPSAESLREHAAMYLPAVMLPSAYVVMDELPLTTARKVDRTRLVAPIEDATARGRTASTATERELAAIWAEVLGRPMVGADEDFFDLGGHSLLATQIVSRVRARLGREIPVRAIFDHPTVAGLAALLSCTPHRAGTSPEIGAADRSAVLPLSGSQERMWLLHQLQPTSAAYNMAGAVRLRGPLAVDALVSALDDVVARHEALRTVFVPHDGRPAQHIEPQASCALETVDLRLLPDGDRFAAATAAMAEHARLPFRLDELPLARFILFVLGDDEHVLFVNMHHIIADQWSLGVLTRDLAACYGARAKGIEPRLPPLSVHFADFVQWHRDWVAGGALDVQLAYWRRQLDSCPVVELPADRGRPPVPSGRGATVTIEIPAVVIGSIERLCARHRVSPFMTLLAALDVVLHRYTGAEDVTVGTAIANRTWLESEELIGVFVNTLVMRADLSGDPTFAELLVRIQKVALDAYANQDVSFATLVSEVRSPRDASRTPLFQVFLNVQNAPSDALALDGLTVELLDIDRGSAQFDLSISVDLEQTRTMTLEYATDLFDADRIERLAGHLCTVLEHAGTGPEQHIASMAMLTEGERRDLARWSAGPVEPREPGLGVHVMFERQVRAGPGRVAVIADDHSLTYAELNARANRLARHLIAMGVRKGDVVGVHLDRSIDALTSVLAAWKAGAAYLPLDPRLPPARLAFMAEDARISALVTRRDPPWPRLPDVPCVRLARDAPIIQSRPDDDPRVGAGGRNLSHVIYTSGSTGRPKGVEVEHHSVVGFLQAMADEPGMAASDIVLSSTTLSFDPSVLELFLPLTCGAQVVIASSDTVTDPTALAQLIHTSGATIMQATPTTWRMLVESGWKGERRLTVLYGGEAMPVETVRWLAERCGAVWNLYGPTETTVWATVHRVDTQELGGVAIPIGAPIANVVCHVLDRHGQLVPVGVPGELVIGGGGVGRGYANRAQLTAERFITAGPTGPSDRVYRTGDLVRWRPGGVLEHLGRLDHQIKVRGHRIEPEEIEAALLTHPGVRTAVVTTYEPTPADVRLVAYFVPAPEQRADPGDLRDHLRRTLPEPMVPSLYVPLAELPITVSNKVDRRHLPVPADVTPAAERRRPETALQAQLAGLWQEVLGQSDIGIDDDFFDLGGHSLLATRLFARIERVTGSAVPLSTLFRAPTVAMLAEAIEAGVGTPHWTSLVAVQPSGDQAPFFYVAPYQITVLSFSNLARELGPDQPFYALHPQGMEGVHPIHQTVEEIAAHNIGELREVQPSGPYRIGGHCSGSWVAFEMARQLQAAGEEVEALVLVDSQPPGIAAPRINVIRYVAGRVAHYRRRRRLVDALRWQVRLLHEQYVTRVGGGAPRRRIAEVRRAHAQAHRRYRAGLVEGDAVLVRSEEWADLPDKAWHLRWQELLTGELWVEVVPGGHAALVEKASSVDLAATIKTVLCGAGVFAAVLPLVCAIIGESGLQLAPVG